MGLIPQIKTMVTTLYNTNALWETLHEILCTWELSDWQVKTSFARKWALTRQMGMKRKDFKFQQNAKGTETGMEVL